jgi:hypothetical protein
MRKFIVYTLIVIISCFFFIQAFAVWAMETFDSIKSTCTSTESYGNVTALSGCAGKSHTVYFEWKKKISKSMYMRKAKQWPKCEKTETLEEWVFKIVCKKGSFGKYYIKKQKVGYNIFMQSVILQTIETSQKESETSWCVESAKSVVNLDTFSNTISSQESPNYIRKIGDSCIWSGLMTWNKKGTDEVCSNDKITSITYILNDKEVDYTTYLNDTYQQAKEWYQKACVTNK